MWGDVTTSLEVVRTGLLMISQLAGTLGRKPMIQPSVLYEIMCYGGRSVAKPTIKYHYFARKTCYSPLLLSHTSHEAPKLHIFVTVV